MKNLLIVMVVLFSFGAGANELSPQGTIKRLIAYSKLGNGDVYVELTTNAASCSNGYYINKSSLGYESILSMLLAAYQANTPIQFIAFENNKWEGSSAPVCELSSVHYVR